MRSLGVTLLIVVAGAAGWFFLARLVMDEGVGDAVNESVGVAFGLLIVVSVVGAIRKARSAGGGDDSADSGDDPEKPS
ncbi:hypothetical protein [Hamadaea tsunoensis]|uniref:hypothetical protein n=1 Tax=Hamadaea tsunoensis TaxID=53368 RepID=UPI000420D60D|nr:hypothetical protein [Hamadaea tsunoensis]